MLLPIGFVLRLKLLSGLRASAAWAFKAVAVTYSRYCIGEAVG